jgi:SAM-dependent methyltransferase
MIFYPMPHYLMRKSVLLKLLKKYNCENKNLLEIGYGAGEIFESYLKMRIKVFGYDFSEEAYQHAQNKYANHSDITLFTAPSELKAESFDVLIASEVLEHIEHDLCALQTWHSYLKTHGVIIVSVPAHKKRWGQSDMAFGHFRRYEKSEIIELVEKAGFSVSEFLTYDFPSCLFLDPLRNNRINKLASKYIPNSGSLETASKISGIARDENKIIRFLSKPIFINPIIFFQQLFYTTNLGSGAIIVGWKK